MKKAIAIIITICVMICTSSCNTNTTTNANANITNDYFIRISGISTYEYDVVYDPDTKVIYVISTGSGNVGNFTMLVNADGTPKLYEENTEIEYSN